MPVTTRPRFQYRPPNFDAPPLAAAPEARFEPAPADGVLPDGFFSTTNLPTYVKTAGTWRRPRLPRLQLVAVRNGLVVRQHPVAHEEIEPLLLRPGIGIGDRLQG